ncbi:hypothetical protein [Alistipes putredinis]|uniref:hypothetical protein n=1 Tax=Alistipes putredinis TaxID=28117 RepID=UPI003FF0F55C
MKPKIKYNLSKIFRNAWYMFRVKMVKNFAEALRKAWKNEKLANIRAMIEGRPLPASEPTPYNIPTGSNPAFAAGCVAMRAGITAIDAKRVKHCFTANCL